MTCRLCTSRYIRAISDLHLIKLFVFRVIRAGLWFSKLQAGEKKRSELRAKKKQKEAQEKLAEKICAQRKRPKPSATPATQQTKKDLPPKKKSRREAKRTGTLAIRTTDMLR